MNSEENTLRLIEMLDEAGKEIDKIDDRLKTYEDKISAVGEAVRIVGERDNVIQLHQNNQHMLLDVLEGLVSSLDFESELKDILLESNFSSYGNITRCVSAANNLMDIIESDIHIGLRGLKAYDEQKRTLESLKIRFANNSYQHLKNIIGHLVSSFILLF
jgi:hypothetical protein